MWIAINILFRDKSVGQRDNFEAHNVLVADMGKFGILAKNDPKSD